MPKITYMLDCTDEDIAALIEYHTRKLRDRHLGPHSVAIAKERIAYWTSHRATNHQPAPPPKTPPTALIQFATPPPPTPRPKHKQRDPVRASTSDVLEAMRNKREQELGPVPIFCYECHHHAPCPHIKVKASSF